MHLAVTGSTLYAAYIAKAQDAGGNWTEKNCYLHKIRTVCIISDFNGNGAVDPEDATLFTAAYSKMDPEADLDANGVVNERDHELFWESYNSGK